MGVGRENRRGGRSRERKLTKKEGIIKTKTDSEYKEYKTGRITMAEISRVLKQMKRNTAPGPDDITMEVFKDMDNENREYILEIKNEWLGKDEIPEEETPARVVLIYKKGDDKSAALLRWPAV